MLSCSIGVVSPMLIQEFFPPHHSVDGLDNHLLIKQYTRDLCQDLSMILCVAKVQFSEAGTEAIS